MRPTHEAEAPGAAGARRVPAAVWWILAASTVLKLALLGPVADIHQRGDERQFVAVARTLVEEGVARYPNPNWDEAHPGPGMPYFMAACYWLAGEEGYLLLARVLQVLLSSGTVLLVCLVAQRFLSDRAAALAAALVAFHPGHVAFTHYFWVESNYAFFVALASWLVLRGRGVPRDGLFHLGAGVVSGVACLWRSVYLTQVPVVCLWLLVWGAGSLPRRARNAVLVVLGAALALAPWAIRNTLRYERFLLVSTNAGALLAKSGNPISPECHDIGLESWRLEYEAYLREHGPDFEGVIPLRPLPPRVPGENIVERNNREIRAGLAFLMAHPWMTLEHTWIRVTYFFNPTSYFIRHLREGTYAGIPPPLAELLVASTLLATMVFLAFFVLGAAVGPWDAHRAYLVAMVLGTLAICAVTAMQSRYRLPLEPLMAPLVADALLRLRELGALRARAWLVAAPLLILMAVLWVRFLPLNYPG